MDLGLNCVHVLVTGASGGIGFETVQQFLGKLCGKLNADYDDR